MFLMFSLIHFVNKGGETDGEKCFWSLLSADMFRVNVWYPAGTSMLKKERKKEKVRTFQQQCIAEGVCFSVSLIKIGGTKYF